uniref:Uncharacterized protein n=1 Tax=Glossina pallidipes TaxID=7398 RepID=A0A1A9ZTV3_GLOPL
MQVRKYSFWNPHVFILLEEFRMKSSFSAIVQHVECSAVQQCLTLNSTLKSPQSPRVGGSAVQQRAWPDEDFFENSRCSQRFK